MSRNRLRRLEFMDLEKKEEEAEETREPGKDICRLTRKVRINTV